jgi:hypothetical protein
MRARALGFLIVAATLASISVAAEPVAPADGSVALRFATVTATLTPARLPPSGEGLLKMTLVPAKDFVWHEAPFIPSRVDIYPPAGWEAEPAEFELPAAQDPTGSQQRTFTITVTAGPSAEGRRKLDVEIKYGVKDASGKGKVYFEDVRLEVELPPPELAPAIEIPAPGVSAKPGTLVLRPAPQPKGGSPVLPALFFATVALLVLAGIAIAVKRAR